MALEFPPSDWKKFKDLYRLAHERFCRQALDAVQAVLKDSEMPAYERLEKIQKLLRAKEKDLSGTFENLARSRAYFQLAIFAHRGLVTDEELAAFSDQTKAALDLILRR